MRKTIVMTIVALLVVALAVPAIAGAEQMELEWLQATCEVEAVPPTVTDGSVHVRGEVHHDVIYMGGNAVGTNDIIFRYDLSLATLNGRGGGTFEVELFGLPAPAFVGHFNGHIASGMLRAQAVGKGSGAFAGDLLKATIEQFTPTAEQLTWMCDGGHVHKAVAVTARIIDK